MNKKSQKRWPESIAEAIRVLDAVLSDEEKRVIREMQISHLSSLRQSVGEMICDEFGLRQGNDALMTTTLEIDAALASMTIIREYWDHLNRATQPQLH